MAILLIVSTVGRLMIIAAILIIVAGYNDFTFLVSFLLIFCGQNVIAAMECTLFQKDTTSHKLEPKVELKLAKKEISGEKSSSN
jgi:hypothetical protein